MKPDPPKVDGQTVNDSSWNSVSIEPQNFATSSGQTLEVADNYQMAKAVADYSSVGDFYQDTGTANNYVVDAIAPRQGIPSYETGQRIRFVAANTNTTASNINVQSIGNVSLLDHEGAALTGGELNSGDQSEIEYDGTNWRLVNGLTGILFQTIDELEISNNASNPNTHIDFAVGKCADSARNFLIRNIAAGFNKDMTTNWAAGSGNGGKPSGVSIIPENWYYVFGLSKYDGTFDAGIDTSTIGTNLLADTVPAGYIKWRRIAAIYTVPTTSYIRAFTQYGDWFMYYGPLTAPISDYKQDGVVQPTLYTVNLVVPPLIKLGAIIEYIVYVLSGMEFNLNLFNSDQQNLAPDTTIGNAPIGVCNGQPINSQRMRSFVIPNSAGQINYRVRVTNPTGIVAMNTLGYIDYRI